MNMLLRYILIIFLSSFVTFISTGYMCQKDISAEQIRSSTIHTGKMRMGYLSFLAQGKKEELQEFLVDLLRDHLVWLDSVVNSEKYLMDMCPAWEYTTLRNLLKDENNKQLTEVFAHLKRLCKSRVKRAKN